MKKLSRADVVLRAALLSAASLLAVGSARAQDEAAAPVAASEPAQAAEEDQSASGPELGEILVTARRVEENVQRVPVSVTAVGPELLQKTGIIDSFSLLREAPGVHALVKLPGNVTAAQQTRVRGVPGMATFFAEAPYPTAQWSYYGPFFDVGSVEILKGPQGTLFGQASNAGAQIVRPARPGTEFGGYLQSEFGTRGRRSVEGAIDLPIVEDKVLLRVSGKVYRRPGFIKEVFSGRRIGPDNYDVARASLILKPVEGIENYTVFNTETVRSNGGAWVLDDFDFYPSALNNIQAALNGMTPAQWNAARDAVLANQIALGPYKMQGWSVGCPATGLTPATKSTVPGPDVSKVIPQPCGFAGGSVTKAHSVVNVTTFDVTDNLTLKNIASHVWGSTLAGYPSDADATIFIINDGNPRSFGARGNLPNTFSNELQVSGSLFDDSLDFVAGAFTYREKQDPRDPSFGSYARSLNDSATRSSYRNTNRSLYGQFNFHFRGGLEGLSVTAGYRNDWDASYQKQETLDPTTFAVLQTLGGPGTPSGEGHWEASSYTLSAQYQIDPSTMIYVNNSKGHSAGGLQRVVGRERFEPDSLNNLEAGLKTTVRAGPLRLRASVAGWYGWFSNVKVATVIVQQIPGSNGGSQLLNLTANAAEARIKGLEAELNGVLGGFEFRVFGNWNKGYYTKYPSVGANGQPIDLSATPFVNTPEWKFGVAPTYHLPLDTGRWGDVSLGANYNYTGMYWAGVNRPVVPTDPTNPGTGALCRVLRTAANGYGPLSADGEWAYKSCARAYSNLDILLRWENVLATPGVDFSLRLTNALGRAGYSFGGGNYEAIGTNVAGPQEPRTLYGTVRYTF